MKIVLIGDSIRMGYQPLVQQKLKGSHDVWGPSQNCRHSLWALDHFGEWVAAQEPDLVHFNFGIHDQTPRYADGQPQILLDQYTLCLRRFIAELDKLPKPCKRIWATTTPLYEVDKTKAQVDWVTRANSHVAAYNAAALPIITAAGIPINDLHALVIASPWHTCINHDGCHMTPAGNDILATAVATAIRHHI